MVELVLTAERREELLALLDDERRLHAEYPKVAEYVDVAPRLPGTGDIRIDAAFDLRFVHYVTGGGKESSNPYWEIVGPFVRTHEGRRVVNGGSPDGSARLAYAQTILQAIYAYAIPAPETLEWISQFCVARPVLELGAGRGYWASQMERVGLVVEAYDFEPPDKVENTSFPRTVGQADVWHHVGDLAEYTVRSSDCSDYVLFLCWPPGWGDTMASKALADFGRAGGDRVIFIGESQGGKTADNAFFEALSAGWKLETQDSQFVSWWNLSDVAQGWVRR